MGYRFHASAPSGEWINDPNALFFADGRYHLFVQHAADAPDFRRIGWGHLSSADLVNWRWRGVVMPPEPNASIYSGSLVMTDPPELFFTRHAPDGPWQTQGRAALHANRAGVTPIGGPLGPAGRNLRDPFVWRSCEGWRMLLARPCDWTRWREDTPSTLELWGSPDRAQWRRLSTIGPWMAAGMMWEVPVLLDFGQRQALVISLIDRRVGTLCEVRYWLGRLSDTGFERASGFPDEGVPLDHGLDFYAAIPNVTDGWPDPARVVVGWASSWSTARSVKWPEARGGGPISMARRVDLAGDRLTLEPAVGRTSDWRGLLRSGGSLTLSTDAGRLTISVGEALHVDRAEAERPVVSRSTSVPLAPSDDISVFVDGPLVEAFWRGIAITAVLPGADKAVLELR